MILFIVSFIAGVLTVLAPCVLPLLPVILAGSVSDTRNRRRPFIIIASLSISVLVFTLILKGSTALISVSPGIWSYISAAILFLFGLTLVFPIAWARLVLKIPGHNKPDRWISKGYGTKSSLWTDVIVGAALGPVFTTCSPTFFVILATVLPQSFAMGLIDLLAYIVGLALVLLLVAWIGQRLVDKLEWATNPEGIFRKFLGIIFIVLAILIAFGFDKRIEASILDSGFFDVTTLEQSIHQALEKPRSVVIPDEVSNATTTGATDPGTKPVKSPLAARQPSQGRYVEIAKPAGFVNSAPFKLADLVGKKVILIDFIDYSCINCERTFPFLKDWYAKYKDQGLEIVAIHTPEFSFEKDISNVTMAANKFGLTFPIVLDNDYATWNAYRNQYWPHKYLIDIHGDVVYDHIGEGNDAITEQHIVQALNERKQVLGESGAVTVGISTAPDYTIAAQSPETYFGGMRNELFGNGAPNTGGTSTYDIPAALSPNQFYLGGTWKINWENAETGSGTTQLAYVFTAKDMYFIAETPDGTTQTAQVLLDGKPIPAAFAGEDVTGNGILTIHESRLYHLYHSSDLGRHRIDIIFKTPGIKAYTFTFG